MVSSYGNFDFTFSASKLREVTEKSTLPNGTVQITDKLGRALSREAYPELRANFSTRWSMDKWAANYSARMIGDTEETFGGQQLHIPTIVYHNIAGSYRFNEQFNIRLGVDNFMDKQPPVSRVNLNINFDQQTYSAVGRFMYLQVSYAL